MRGLNRDGNQQDQWLLLQQLPWLSAYLLVVVSLSPACQKIKRPLMHHILIECFSKFSIYTSGSLSSSTIVFYLLRPEQLHLRICQSDE